MSDSENKNTLKKIDPSLFEEYENKIYAYERLITFLTLTVSENLKEMKNDLPNNPSLQLIQNMIDSYYVKATENIACKSLGQLKNLPDLILLQYSNSMNNKK